MFCTNYSPNDWDLPSLFEKYITSVEKEIQSKLGITTGRLLHNLLNEFAMLLIKNKSNLVSDKEVMQLDFWNTYGLSARKMEFLQLVAQSGIFLVIPHKDEEWYSVNYNLLSNYLTAKHIVESFSDKAALIDFVKKDFLNIDKNGYVRNYYAQEAIGFICSLYSEKNGDELQEIIDCITVYKEEVINDYVHSFTWRKAKNYISKVAKAVTGILSIEAIGGNGKEIDINELQNNSNDVDLNFSL